MARARRGVTQGSQVGAGGPRMAPMEATPGLWPWRSTAFPCAGEPISQRRLVHAPRGCDTPSTSVTVPLALLTASDGGVGPGAGPPTVGESPYSTTCVSLCLQRERVRPLHGDIPSRNEATVRCNVTCIGGRALPLERKRPRPRSRSSEDGKWRAEVAPTATASDPTRRCRSGARRRDSSSSASSWRRRRSSRWSACKCPARGWAPAAATRRRRTRPD